MRLLSALTCAALLLAGSAPAQPSEVVPRVRCADAAARTLLLQGRQESPTLRRLQAELEETDLIVLVSVTPRAPSLTSTNQDFHGSTRLMGKAGGHRYVSIWIDSQWFDESSWRRRAALLAHEFQHALEIAADPSVVDQNSLAVCFTRIGREWATLRFETDAALDIETRVSRELRAAASRPSTSSEPSTAVLR
jgi:hypothetical protein